MGTAGVVSVLANITHDTSEVPASCISDYLRITFGSNLTPTPILTLTLTLISLSLDPSPNWSQRADVLEMAVDIMGALCFTLVTTVQDCLGLFRVRIV